MVHQELFIHVVIMVGQINESIYIKWLRHLIERSKPTAEQPVLLIMDNHNNHCILEAWEVVNANNDVMVSLPPHSSQRLQPHESLQQGMRHVYKIQKYGKITRYEIAGLFNKAYTRVATCYIFRSRFLLPLVIIRPKLMIKKVWLLLLSLRHTFLNSWVLVTLFHFRLHLVILVTMKHFRLLHLVLFNRNWQFCPDPNYAKY